MLNKNQTFEHFNDEEDEKGMINKLIDQMGYSKYQFFITILAATILAVDGAQSILLAILLSLINESTKLTEYNLALVNTIESIGYTLATIIINIVTQYLSNKQSIQFFSILSLLFTGLSLTTFNFYFVCFTRFSFGFCIGSIDLLIYILLIENSPTKLRGFLSTFIFIFYPIGALLLSFSGYTLLEEGKSDKNYYILLLVPFAFLLFFTCLIFLLQESPRTLIMENKVEEGINVIQKMNSFNDKNNEMTTKHKEELIVEMKEKIKRKHTLKLTGKSSDIKIRQSSNSIEMNNKINENEIIVDDFEKLTLFEKFKRLFNKNYRKYTIIIWIVVIFSSFTLNGIFFMLPTTAPELTKSTFKGVLLSVFIEIPSNIFTSIMIENNKTGRLWAMKIGLIGALTMSIVHFIYLKPMLYIDCVLKFFINIPVSVITVYGSELYDSKIRIFGTSAINFWKRISIMVSPLTIAYLDNHYGSAAGYFVFTPCVFIALFFSFFLDIETRGVPLDEFGKD